MKGKKQIRIVQSGKNDNLIFLRQKRKWIFQKRKIIDSKCKCLCIGETIKAFSKGIYYIKLIKPAKVKEGIIRLNAKKKGITFPL